MFRYVQILVKKNYKWQIIYNNTIKKLLRISIALTSTTLLITVYIVTLLVKMVVLTVILHVAIEINDKKDS